MRPFALLLAFVISGHPLVEAAQDPLSTTYPAQTEFGESVTSQTLVPRLGVAFRKHVAPSQLVFQLLLLAVLPLKAQLPLATGRLTQERVATAAQRIAEKINNRHWSFPFSAQDSLLFRLHLSQVDTIGRNLVYRRIWDLVPEHQISTTAQATDYRIVITPERLSDWRNFKGAHVWVRNRQSTITHNFVAQKNLSGEWTVRNLPFSPAQHLSATVQGTSLEITFEPDPKRLTEIAELTVNVGRVSAGFRSLNATSIPASVTFEAIQRKPSSSPSLDTPRTFKTAA